MIRLGGMPAFFSSLIASRLSYRAGFERSHGDHNRPGQRHAKASVCARRWNPPPRPDARRPGATAAGEGFASRMPVQIFDLAVFHVSAEHVLDETVQSRRDMKTAKRLLIRLLTEAGMPPKRIITDKLRLYEGAKREVMPAVGHHSHKGLNNRAENSHLPLRKRERTMQGFRSPESAAFHLDLLYDSKSLRHPTSKTIGASHPHLSHPRNGALEGPHRRV